MQVRQIVEIAKRFHSAMEFQVYYLSSVSLKYYAYMMVGQPLVTNISSRLTLIKCCFASFKLQMSLEMMKPFTHRVEQVSSSSGGSSSYFSKSVVLCWDFLLMLSLTTQGSDYPLLCYYIQERIKLLRLREFILMPYILKNFIVKLFVKIYSLIKFVVLVEWYWKFW